MPDTTVIHEANKRAWPVQALIRDAHPCMFRYLAASTSTSKAVVIFRNWHDLEVGQQPWQLHKVHHYSRKQAGGERSILEQSGQQTKWPGEWVSQGFILYDWRSKHWATSAFWICFFLFFKNPLIKQEYFLKILFPYSFRKIRGDNKQPNYLLFLSSHGAFNSSDNLNTSSITKKKSTWFYGNKMPHFKRDFLWCLPILSKDELHVMSTLFLITHFP